MIIDRMPLAGKAAYLQAAGGVFNLGGATSHAGESPALPKAVALQVSSIDLLLEAADLGPLFVRREPVLHIELRKELFPRLFADPYAHRVHTVGGADDFLRGEFTGAEAMEVDGEMCLVSTGSGDSEWRSPLFRFGEPFDLASAAWDIPSTRLMPPESLAYSLVLEVWPYNVPPPANPAVVVLAHEVDGRAVRVKEVLTIGPGRPVSRIIAYRLRLLAKVSHDTALRERYASAADAPLRGRPLLSAVHLLEPRDSSLVFSSLAEVASAASEYRLMPAAGSAITRMVCRVPITAFLSAGETISLRVTGGHFTTVEARLQATVLMRPPNTDKSLAP